MKKTTAIVIFVFLVAGLSYGYFKNLQSAPKLSFVQKIKKEKEIDWQTYTNKDYGYSLKYPKGWEIVEWDIKKAAELASVPNGSIWQHATFEGSGGKFELLVWENSAGAPARTWVSWFRHEDLEIKNIPLEPSITISSVPAISYVQHKTSRKKPIHYVFFGSGTKVYELMFERSDISGTLLTADTLPPHAIFDRVRDSFVLLSQ